MVGRSLTVVGRSLTAVVGGSLTIVVGGSLVVTEGKSFTVTVEGSLTFTIRRSFVVAVLGHLLYQEVGRTPTWTFRIEHLRSKGVWPTICV